MHNHINRFVRNIETKYLCDDDNLNIETVLFVPERIAAKTSIPWISIFSHISNFITFPEDQGIRAIDNFTTQETSDGIQTLKLEYHSMNNELCSVSADLSITKFKSFIFDTDVSSLTATNSPSAIISAKFDYVYGNEENSVYPNITIDNLVRNIGFDINLSGNDTDTVSAELNLSVNNSFVSAISSNSYTLVNQSVRSIDDLSVGEISNGIQRLILTYTDATGTHEPSIDLSVTKFNSFTFDTENDSLSNDSSNFAVISANLNYTYGLSNYSETPSITLSNIVRKETGVRSIDDLSVEEGENGIQTLKLKYMDGILGETISSANLSVTKLGQFRFKTSETSLTSISAPSAKISVNLDYAYGGCLSSTSHSTTIKNLVRTLSIDNLALSGDGNDISASITLYKNGNNMDSVYSNIYNVPGGGGITGEYIKSLDNIDLSVTEDAFNNPRLAVGITFTSCDGETCLPAVLLSGDIGGSY